MAVRLDLRRDLPKLQKALPSLSTRRARCEYAAPCAVGVMVNPRKRDWLDSAPYDDTQIDTLIRNGMVKAPKEQVDDLRCLQLLFDAGNADGLESYVAVLSRKYLADKPPHSADGHGPTRSTPGVVGPQELGGE